MRLKSSVVVAASVEKTWEVVGDDFGNVWEWTSSLRSSRLEGELGVGAVRVCEGVGFGPFKPGVVREVLLEFDPLRGTFTYKAIAGLPRFIRSAQNTWCIDCLDTERTRIRFNASVHLKWWAVPLGVVLPWLMARDVRLFEEEMKHRIENDKPHPRKLEMLQKAGFAAS